MRVHLFEYERKFKFFFLHFVVNFEFLKLKCKRWVWVLSNFDSIRSKKKTVEKLKLDVNLVYKFGDKLDKKESRSISRLSQVKYDKTPFVKEFLQIGSPALKLNFIWFDLLPQTSFHKTPIHIKKQFWNAGIFAFLILVEIH